jgi:hypothetical protein
MPAWVLHIKYSRSISKFHGSWSVSKFLAHMRGGEPEQSRGVRRRRPLAGHICSSAFDVGSCHCSGYSTLHTASISKCVNQ